MLRYQNVVQCVGAYRPNSIPTNFPNYPLNPAFHCLCYRHKTSTVAQKHASINICYANTNQLVAAIYSYRPVRQCLIGQTDGRNVCKGNTVQGRLSTCGGTAYGHHINCAVRAVLHRAQRLVQQTGVTVNCTVQHIGQSVLKGNWG